MKGELGQREEQELERLAKEDSFLAEAYEGLQQLPEGEHARRMQSLQKRLEGRAAEGQSRSWRLAIAAAAVLLTLSLTLWLYWPESSSELAQTPELPVAEEKRSPEAEESSAAREAAPEDAMDTETAPPPPPAAEEAPPPKATPAAPEETADPPAFAKAPETEEPPAKAEEAATDSFLAFREEAASARESEVPSNNDISPPVAAMRRSETADSGAPDRARSFIKRLASPVVGRQAYQDYLRDSLRYPQAARAIGLEGEVALVFEIDQDGRPVRIQVLDSLGYGAEAEAKRLLRNGPAWAPPGGKGVYSIRFMPPRD
jgi:TonB family protein